LTGAVTRVLVIVPESLVHQWFVEMFRKFNLWFTIMDGERCRAVTELDESVNPFLEEQLVIVSQEFLLKEPRWGMQSTLGEWDLAVFDEAHHIRWKKDELTPEYELATKICAASKGLILLTATPEQLGIESHFARLQLLDPERFYDLPTFLKENEGHLETAEIARDLLDEKMLDKVQLQSLGEILHDEKDLKIWLKDTIGNKKDIMEALVDRHGPGRMIFRNTRKVMSNFPERKLITHKLALPDALKEKLSEVETDNIVELKDSVDLASIKLGLQNDPRIHWLIETLRVHGDEKFLFICSTRAKAEAIEEAFRQHSGRKTVLFHEGMSLMQRDKNAVFFANPEGADILFCSEIGSEGRNFQFSHNLILWDIPVLPGLLEQRIGRLDRIGQSETIRIHVPYFENSVQEVLVRFYNEGLDAFEHSLHGGNILREHLQGQLFESMQKVEKQTADRQQFLDALIKETAKQAAAVRLQLNEGRDRLLEYNSFRKEEAEALAERVAEGDSDHQLEGFLEACFDYFGILYEEMSPGVWKVAPGPNMITDALPALLPEGQMMGLRRQKALHDEQMTFLSWEHPLVAGMIDELLSTEKGNASFALWRDDESRTLLLETVFVAECGAAADLQIARFFPATPVRVLVNHKLEDYRETFSTELIQENIQEGEAHRVLDIEQESEQLIPAMLEKAKELAEESKNKLIAKAMKNMQQHQEAGINRLSLYFSSF
ncbi:MAG: RNA polymerase-associated protein RapA, partial [Lentisphaeraceae bacterium]|nr:RNA polymerase-associated protein RapA [Lentisphaeraceae bacterium]